MNMDLLEAFLAIAETHSLVELLKNCIFLKRQQRQESKYWREN